MKNQYFGDVRDLFKYDIIQTLITQSDYLDNFFFISMLTPDDNSNEGNKINYNKAKAGFHNLDLLYFLHSATQNKRDIRKIATYFNTYNINIDLIDDLFYSNFRDEYFKKVEKRLKENSLIFFDPDNGLEVKNNNEKHLLFSELEFIFNKANSESLVMIYQHFPRVRRELYISERLKEIEDKLECTCNYISDNEIVFFFISKNEELNKEVNYIIKSYNQKYSRLLSQHKKDLIETQLELSLQT